MSKNPTNKVILLIIDPQIDFHPGGSLGIVGANEDSERTAKLILTHINDIDEIYVTLDSHHVSIFIYNINFLAIFFLFHFIVMIFIIYIYIYICIA